MQIKFAILADAATATMDGKFSILGGDLGTVSATSFPAMHPVMGLVVKLVGRPEELGTEHTLRTEISTPGGVTGQNVEAPFVLREPTNGSTEYTSAGFVVNVIGLLLPEPGTYMVHLFADDEELETLSFEARLVTVAAPDQVTPPEEPDADSTRGELDAHSDA